MRNITVVLLALFAISIVHSQDSLSHKQDKALFLSMDGYRFNNFGFRYSYSTGISFDAYLSLDLDTQTPDQPGVYNRITNRSLTFGLLARYVAYRLDDACFYLAIGPQFSTNRNVQQAQPINGPTQFTYTTTSLEYDLNGGVGVEYFVTARLSLSGQLLAVGSITYHSKWTGSTDKQNMTEKDLYIGRGNIIVAFYF